MQTACVDIASADIIIASLACSRGCSGRGVCRLGKCFCEPGFAGEDCSINFQTPPVVRIISPSQCDVQVAGDCSSGIIVTGFNFFSSRGLVCRFGDIVTKATYISPFSVLCDLPSIPAHQ
jgi:hypothetical protein